MSKKDTNTSNTEDKLPTSFSCTDDPSLSFPSSTGSFINLGDAMGESSSIQSSVGVCADLFSGGTLKLVLCVTGMAKDRYYVFTWLVRGENAWENQLGPDSIATCRHVIF
jgi:hypothetical protein